MQAMSPMTPQDGRGFPDINLPLSTTGATHSVQQDAFAACSVAPPTNENRPMAEPLASETLTLAATSAMKGLAHESLQPRLKQESLLDSKPLLVLFDLNGVLVHREPFGSRRPQEDMRNAVCLYTASKRVVFVRRQLEKFFLTLWENRIRIGVWTSAQGHNAGDLVSALSQVVPSFNKAMFLDGNVIIDQQYCLNFGRVDLQDSEKEVYVKSERELTRHPLWKSILKQHQLILVDDSPVKNAINTRIIGIHPKTFVPTNERTRDEKTFEYLLKYLVKMKQGGLQPFNFARRNPIHELLPLHFNPPLEMPKIDTTRLYDKILEHTRPMDYSRNIKLLLQLHEDGLLSPDEYILNAKVLLDYKGNNASNARDIIDGHLKRHKRFVSRLSNQ